MNSVFATRGMFVAPHALAAESGLAILREGGNALEAMIAAAATISVVYPHMNGIGGDSFWLIHEPGKEPISIDACGRAARIASREWYAGHNVQAIPHRGPLAANTVAGTISGWAQAIMLARNRWDGHHSTKRLLEDAIHYAEHGIVVTASQSACTQSKLAELKDLPGFAMRFLPDGKVPQAGTTLRQPTLAATMRHLAKRGLNDFYRGELARSIADDLARLGSPLTLADLEAHEAEEVQPVRLDHSLGAIYNMAPPTQGVISLAILGILDRLGLKDVPADSADYVHLCVEATKQAFRQIRDRYVTDPHYMTVHPQQLVADVSLAPLAEAVDRTRAAPWGNQSAPGDTVWMGCIDGAGRAVSFIQSIYHEFGSGLVLPQTGINWQNRGASFSLDPKALQTLEPGRKPFHTLNPALARFKDGAVMPYGTMGGDGQPQTQCAVFTRIAVYGQGVQQAIAAPRWLLGRTWGQASDTLKLESRFDPAVVAELQRRGHDTEVLRAFDETMGHAGAIKRSADGVLEGGYDPRSDGAAAGY
jgi:gamma-glutamyltranspeptidase/glutathione hydrolase